MLKHCSKRLARIDALHKTLPCVHASVALQTIATQIGHDPDPCKYTITNTNTNTQIGHDLDSCIGRPPANRYTNWL